MQFSLVDGQKLTAFPSGRGTCGICGTATIAKCGPRVMHHWAHATRQSCDPWWENETPWHRQWKSLFPIDWLEVSHVSSTGEIHRADIKTPHGLVIEVQHSAMSDAERISREEFYGNLVWIIDGRGFRSNFDIYHPLPHPASSLAADLVWYKARRGLEGAAYGIFMRLSENLAHYPALTKRTVELDAMYEIHSIDQIRDTVIDAYYGHHQYDWVRPRKTWLDAKCPVYIDFGDDRLVRLQRYDETGLPCIRLVSKREFVQHAMRSQLASEIIP